MRIKRTFTIDGWISSGGEAAAGDFSGSDTAKQQRTKLRNMIQSTENVDFVYDDVSESVAIIKASIKEVATDESTPTHYAVKMTVITGTNALDSG